MHIVKYRDSAVSYARTAELINNSWTDQDAVWVQDSGGPRNHVY